MTTKSIEGQPVEARVLMDSFAQRTGLRNNDHLNINSVSLAASLVAKNYSAPFSTTSRL